jgi:L-fuculose-phosphate aldolase
MNQSLKLKRQIVEIGKRLYQKGFVAANDGNLSVKMKNRIIVTPTLKFKGFLKVNDLVTTDFEGKRIEGKLKPTSELPLHLFVYKKRQDVGAVIHAHPPYGTALAVAGMELPENVLPEVFLSLGKIPLASYGTPSTRELSDSISKLILKYDAILLKNHGVLAVGWSRLILSWKEWSILHKSFLLLTLWAKWVNSPDHRWISLRKSDLAQNPNLNKRKNDKKSHCG